MLRILGSYLPGFSALTIVVLLLGGIELIAIGIIGEYVGRIYDEVKGRPLYLVRARRNLADPEARQPASGHRADAGTARHAVATASCMAVPLFDTASAAGAADRGDQRARSPGWSNPGRFILGPEVEGFEQELAAYVGSRRRRSASATAPMR